MRPHPADGAPPALAIPADALTAIVGLGSKTTEARIALEAASAHVGHEPTLETWIRGGLRACARARLIGNTAGSRSRGAVGADLPD